MSFKIPRAEGKWKFSVRPGGWVVVQAADGSGIRQRMMLTESRGRASLSLAGKLWAGPIREGREAQGGGAADIKAALTAQFPGKVRKILVKAGQVVEAGEKLVLVEAMKMEFAVQAPAAGKVIQVLVKDAQQISPGDRFVDFEASGV